MNGPDRSAGGTGRTARLDRVRSWLRWFRHADVGWGWLLPRRALLPALALWSLWGLFVLQRPLGRVGNRCATVDACSAALGEFTAAETGVVLTELGYGVLTVVVVYVLAVVFTAVLGHLLDVRSLLPRVFAPDDDELLAVGVVLVAALLAYLGGSVGAAYTLVGVVVLYVLYFPSLFATALLFESGLAGVVGTIPGLLGTVLSLGSALVLAVVVPAVQVLWWYAIATGAVRTTRSDAGGEDATRFD